MLVFKEIAGFQETILSLNLNTNLEMNVLPSVIRDSLVQKSYTYGRLNSGRPKISMS